MQGKFRENLTSALLLFMMLCASITMFPQAADDCANATTLSINASPSTDTMDCNFTTQTNEPFECAGATNNYQRLTSWYRFNSGSNDYLWLRYNELYNPNNPITSGNTTRINVFGPFGSGMGCMPTSQDNIACQAVAGTNTGFNLTDLSTNSDYLVQVVFYEKTTGNSCDFLEYELSIETPVMDEATCNVPVDTGCTYATYPSTTHVVNTCEGDTMEVSHPDTNHSTQYCYEFTAASIQVEFNVVISSDCGSGPGQSSGNVAFIEWKVYESGNCGSVIDSGDISDLIIDPLTVGTAYTLCYEFATPQTTWGCTHSKHRPFFVGANNNNSTLLPIEFIDLSVRTTITGDELTWYSNDVSDVVEFQIQASSDGQDFNISNTIKRGFQNRMTQPVTRDLLGKYVRVVGLNDFGKKVRSNLVRINSNRLRNTEVTTLPDAIKVSWHSYEAEELQILVTDLHGNSIFASNMRSEKGQQSALIDRSHLARGIFLVTIVSGNYNETFKVFL